MIFTFWKQPGGKTLKCESQHFTGSEYGAISLFLLRVGFVMEDHGHKITFEKEEN